MESYIKTCQGTKPGDTINPIYADRILTAAMISGAIDAYNDHQYQKALDMYQSAFQLPGVNNCVFITASSNKLETGSS